MVQPSGHPVVLIHGLGGARLTLEPLAWALRQRGRRVLNLSYYALGLEGAFKAVREQIESRGLLGAEVDLVTHSMGGIVGRLLLDRGVVRAGRFVQLAPPNRGASLAKRLGGNRFFSWIPATRDLVPGAFDRLRFPSGVQLGVVAGAAPFPWTSLESTEELSRWLESRPSDGVVRVDETWLPQARDWILVPRFHVTLPYGEEIASEVMSFLRSGSFREEALRLGAHAPLAG